MIGPSRTALAAAAHRAAHQVVDGGAIFRDPLALRIVGDEADAIVAEARADPQRRGMRAFIAARSRFADECAAAALERGVRQFVVLGAGLDTSAYRGAAGAARVFEVDHPATQAWKRERLRSTGIALPANLTFAPCDFECERVEQALAAAGFSARAPTFVAWLGVVPYLSSAAVLRILRMVGAFPRASAIVFDYGEPAESLSPRARRSRERRAARVAALGEPFRSAFTPAALGEELRAAGFTAIDDLGGRALLARYLRGVSGAPDEHGGHVVHAAV